MGFKIFFPPISLPREEVVLDSFTRLSGRESKPGPCLLHTYQRPTGWECLHNVKRQRLEGSCSTQCCHLQRSPLSRARDKVAEKARRERKTKRHWCKDCLSQQIAAILTALPLAGASLPFSVSSTTSFFSFRSWKEQKSREVTPIPGVWVREAADQV